MTSLQWGGRFSEPPDPALLAFGSSLGEDLILAPFDVRCSLAHVEALAGGGVIDGQSAAALRAALSRVESEIASGEFAAYARASGAEDVHGAIDARVRDLAPVAGESLHAGRSRNDQVATTLLLYGRDRATCGAALCGRIGLRLVEMAEAELEAGTLIAGTTHWQPAQPILLAFYLAAAAMPFARSAMRFSRAGEDAAAESPLGSAALAGSTLPLDRAAAARALSFERPSRNALDAIGTRDSVLDVAHAAVRACVDASRVSEEFVIWCAPAFGYLRLGDAASTGSSLMPQKRNPDPFELVRGRASGLVGAYAGALGTLCGLALSYHRDLQQTKALAMAAIEEGLQVLDAFGRALAHVSFNRERCTARAGDGYTVATDMADVLIASGVSARAAHAEVGKAIARAEREESALGGAPNPHASVEGKRTTGSTAPGEVRATLQELRDRFARYAQA